MKFDLQSIIIAITGLLTGIGGMWGIKNSGSKNKYQILIDKYEELNKSQAKKNDELEAKNDVLEKEIQLLKVKQAGLEAKIMFDNAIKIASKKAKWRKFSDGKMASFNKAYEKKYILPFGKDPLLYPGKTDTEFWGKETGQEYSKKDTYVISTGNDWSGFEVVTDKFGNSEDWLFHVEPMYLGDDIIGTQGTEIMSKPDLMKLLKLN